MIGSLSAVEETAFALLATYLLHSTLLLGGAALLLWLARARNDALIERAWKLAAMTGLVTAPLSMACGVSRPLELFHAQAFSRGERAEGDAAPHRVAASLEAEFSSPAVLTEVAEDDSSASSPRSELGSSLENANASFLDVPDAERTPAHLENVGPTTAPGVPPKGSLSNMLARGEARAARGSAEQSRSLGASPYRSAVRIVLGVAAAIIAIGLLRLIARTWRLQRRLAQCVEASSGHATASLARVLRRSGTRRRMRLFLSEEFDEPIACGAWRGTIVLPREMESRCSRHELEALLAHEAAHLARGDTRWLLLGQVLCVCLPFQPLNFVAQQAWRRREEFLCDAWAVRHGARALSLAECLTHAAERRLNARPCEIGLAVSGSRSTLSQRIERLVEGRFATATNERSLRRKATTYVVLAAMVMSVWGPRGDASFPTQRDAGLEVNTGLEASANGEYPYSNVTHEETPSEKLREPLSETPPNDGPAVHAPHATSDLHQEWMRLDAELTHADRLLQRLPDDPAIHELAERLRERRKTLRRQWEARNRHETR